MNTEYRIPTLENVYYFFWNIIKFGEYCTIMLEKEMEITEFNCVF